MALQADLPPLDFGGIRGPKRQGYLAAVRSGLDRDYEPMEQVFSAVIGRTRRKLGAE
jgi:cell filamentation protein